MARESLAIFAALATVEVRPLADVIEECMADTAAYLARTRHALNLDLQERDDLSAYLDDVEALDRLERMEEEERAGAATTPAMLRAAAESDRRKMRCTETDDALDFWQRMGGDEFVPVAVNLHD